MDGGRELFSIIYPSAVGARGFLRVGSLKWNPVPVHSDISISRVRARGAFVNQNSHLHPRASTVSLTIELPRQYP